LPEMWTSLASRRTVLIMQIPEDRSTIIACVHSDIFHSDEVMACALLRIAAGDVDVVVIRSRLAKDWERADYVIDVGGQYDNLKWFDHHQQAGAGKRDNNLSYSSFGLMWKHLGITAVRTLLQSQKLVELKDTEILEVYNDIEPFIMGIDAHDQAQLNVAAKCIHDKSIRLEVSTVQNVISGMNCIPLMEPGSQAQSNVQFGKALAFAEDFLRRFILRKASKVLAYAYTKSRDAGAGSIILEQYCDWHQAVSEMPHVEYVIYPSVNGKSYAVQAVKAVPGPNSVNNLRRPFPAEWSGADATTLPRLSGVRSAIFCHRDRFIASCSTLEGAIELVNASINYERNPKPQNQN